MYINLYFNYINIKYGVCYFRGSRLRIIGRKALNSKFNMAYYFRGSRLRIIGRKAINSKFMAKY